jgi:hypothetical protein
VKVGLTKTRKPLEEDTKLLLLPGYLVDRLKEVSVKRGVSLSEFASDALQQALRADEMGAKSSEAVDVFKMVKIQKSAGAIVVPRSSLSFLIEKLHDLDVSDLKELWREAGHWYGSYLSSKIRKEDLLPFIEKELLYTWNLDEVKLGGDDEVFVQLTCFVMEIEFTELLLGYLLGIMESLGYREVERDYMRGIANLKYSRAPRHAKLI